MTVRQISDSSLLKIAKIIAGRFSREKFLNFLVEIGEKTLQEIDEDSTSLSSKSKQFALILRKYNEAESFHTENQRQVLRKIVKKIVADLSPGSSQEEQLRQILMQENFETNCDSLCNETAEQFISSDMPPKTMPIVDPKNNDLSHSFDELDNQNVEDDYLSDEKSDEEIIDEGETPPAEPYDASKINFQVKQITVDLIVKRMKANPPEIEMKTNFQRQAGLWTTAQKSRLIESLLLRIPLPAFYFDGSNDDKWLIVDGLQRLYTFKEYIIDQSLELTSLEYLTDVENCTFSALPRHMQRRIEETQLLTVIIQPGTPEDVKFNIFKRINTGGIRLEPQEIRHALNQGIPADFVASLAQQQEFKEAVIKLPTERMVDREYVLRFLAFYSIEKYGEDQYRPDMDSFLQKFMKKIASFSSNRRQEMQQAFIQSMRRAKMIFGKRAFRKIGAKGEARKINKALFEAWSVSLALLDEVAYEKLLLHKERLNQMYIKLLEDSTFNMSITTGTGGDFQVRTRFERINQLIQQVINDE